MSRVRIFPAWRQPDCAHCAEPLPYPHVGGVPGRGPVGETVGVCHPDDPLRPDCYRRVTVYLEPLGALAGVRPLPAGVRDLIERHQPKVTLAGGELILFCSCARFSATISVPDTLDHLVGLHDAHAQPRPRPAPVPVGEAIR